jgi:hypothetical protein
VPNPKAVVLGIIQVLVDITLRIHNHSCVTLLVSDQIGGVRKAPQVKLLEYHVTGPLGLLKLNSRLSRMLNPQEVKAK